MLRKIKNKKNKNSMPLETLREVASLGLYHHISDRLSKVQINSDK